MRACQASEAAEARSTRFFQKVPGGATSSGRREGFTTSAATSWSAHGSFWIS